MRRVDWAARLAAVIADAETRAFAYGAHDCARFAAACVEAQTGANPIADLAYASAREALAIIRREGSLFLAVARRLHGVAPSIARRGDIAIAPIGHRGRDILALIDGESLIAPAARGLARAPRARMTSAFRV